MIIATKKGKQGEYSDFVIYVYEWCVFVCTCAVWNNRVTGVPHLYHCGIAYIMELHLAYYCISLLSSSRLNIHSSNNNLYNFQSIAWTLHYLQVTVVSFQLFKPPILSLLCVYVGLKQAKVNFPAVSAVAKNAVCFCSVGYFQSSRWTLQTSQSPAYTVSQPRKRLNIKPATRKYTEKMCNFSSCVPLRCFVVEEKKTVKKKHGGNLPKAPEMVKDCGMCLQM